MRDEDFAAAWRVADQVLAGRDPATRDDPGLPYHLRWVWDGTPPDEQDVLVRCYHGLGDTLQFARFLPALGARAARVTLEVQPALMGLLARVPGVDRMVPFDPAAPLPPSACDVEIMELAHMLRAEAAGISACVPYLAAEAWPGLPQAAIGLCWQAGDWDAARSIALEKLLAACAAPGQRFVSLQRGPAAAEARGAAFVNPGDNDCDVARSAALIAGVSCVVTVDSMVAHLAGALGRPVVLLLKAKADWRWGRAGRSAWYPSVAMLRQERPGDWERPFEKVGKQSFLEKTFDC